MRFLSPSGKSLVGSTTRLEAYSDAVIAIVLTILVLELKVPELQDESVRGVFAALGTILPKLLGFTASFLTISVFWVNHHHFFHEVDQADGRFLWINNALLFWLSLVPFTTAFLGEHPMAQGAIFLYCLVLFFAAASYFLLHRYAAGAGLLHAHITQDQKSTHSVRSWAGMAGYALATTAAPFFPLLSFILMIAIPAYYIAPRLMHDHEAADERTE